MKQLAAWKSLVLEYHRITKQGVIDIREVHSSPLFNNAAINRILFNKFLPIHLFNWTKVKLIAIKPFSNIP